MSTRQSSWQLKKRWAWHSCSRFLIGALALSSANVAEMRIPTVLTTGRRIEILLQSSQLSASVDGGVVGDKRGERVPWCCRRLWELFEAIAASLNIRLWTEKITPSREGRSGVFLAFDYWQRGQVAATAERRPIHSNSVRNILGSSEDVYIRISMYKREKKISDREAMTFEVRGTRCRLGLFTLIVAAANIRNAHILAHVLTHAYSHTHTARARERKKRSLAAIAVCPTAERVVTASFHSSFVRCIPHHQECQS